MQAEEIARLLHARKIGNGKWMAKCPAHNERTGSLSITAMKEGVRLHCFGGCSQADVLAVMGLKWRDLKYNQTTDPKAWKALQQAASAEERKKAARKRFEYDRQRWFIVRCCLGALLIRRRRDERLRELWHVAIRKSLMLDSNVPKAAEMWPDGFGEPEDWEEDREWEASGKLKPQQRFEQWQSEDGKEGIDGGPGHFVFYGPNYRIVEFWEITSKLVGKDIAEYLLL